MFIHLHNHTHFSILEWLPKPKDLVEAAKKHWMTAIAITDTANLHGCHELYKTALWAWIKPILWTEIFVQSSLDPNITHKTVLLAKNLAWYQNIIALTSKAALEHHWNPFITFEELSQMSSDIICLSGPINWEIPYYILSGQSEEKIVEKIKSYEEIFSWEFYLELMYHDDIPKQKLVTDKLIELHKKYWFKVVATNNCYYINKEDKKTQDVIQALWTWHQIENPDRPTKITWDYSFLSPDEMESMFGFIPEALSNTLKIADQIDIKIETGWILIPKYDLPEEDQKIYEEALEIEKEEYYIWDDDNERKDHTKKLTSDEWYLRYLSYSWLNWRYDYWIPKEQLFKLVQKLDRPGLQKKLTESSPEELKELSLTFYSEEKKEILESFSQELQDKIERLEYELVVVHEMWFDAYFLIVADYINRARAQSIPVGPWRWSAAGSLMAFLSWITDLDPLPYKLLFERFLNPSRVSMPDIDTDFADDARDKVIEYCRNKYGSDHVAQICTFGTFAARAAVKDVARVMWLEFSESNSLAKLIPEKPGTKLKKALEESLEFRDAYDNNELYKDIIDTALKIEWNVRQIWVHACAVIIAPQPMNNFTALSHPPKDQESIITQYSAYPLEDLWLLKMDFLWLRNLTIIKRTQKIIKANKWIDFDILKVDLNDPKVLEVFCNWDTTWVFQFESDWMRKYLKDLWPDSFEDLIAMVSLYRPGPLAYIPTYIDVKYGRKPLMYLTDELRAILEEAWYSEDEILEEKRKLEEDLKPILDVTYWIAVYQEQLMFIVQYMAWFSLWEADLLRRWVWKKKLDVVEALKKEFIEKWENYKQYKRETTNYIYTEMIMPAANYSFNKSHAACYAFISYQTAYLKAYYPAEFLTAVMVSDEENLERIAMEVSECEEKWISVLPPSVNESLKHFTYIDDNTIRYWLKALKWIWDWPIEALISERKEWEYKNLQDLVKRAWREVINKKSLEALSLSGAMDNFWERWVIYKNISNIIKYSKHEEKATNSMQMWLFADTKEDKLVLEDFPAFTFEEKLKWEELVVGQSISWHPLDWLSRYIEKRSQNTKIMKLDFDEIAKLPDKKKNNQVVQCVGYIKDFRTTMTKTGWTMAFLYCESYWFDFEITVFTKDYEKYKDIIEAWKIVIVTWILRINEEYKRKSVFPRDLKTVWLTTVRDQAQSLNLLDGNKFSKWKKLEDVKASDIKDEEKTTSPLTPLLPGEGEQKNVPEKNIWEKNNSWENFEEKNKIISEKNSTKNLEKITEYIVEIPTTAKKEDLVNLKSFLQTQTSWDIEIFISLKWQKITTKLKINDLENLKNWEKNNF